MSAHGHHWSENLPHHGGLLFRIASLDCAEGSLILLQECLEDALVDIDAGRSHANLSTIRPEREGECFYCLLAVNENV